MFGQQFGIFTQSNQSKKSRRPSFAYDTRRKNRTDEYALCLRKGLGKDVKSKIDGCRSFTQGTREPGIGPGGGFFTLPNNLLFEGPRQQAEFMNDLQRMAIEETRLQIPLLMTEEGTHGLMCSGGTVFPEGLGIGSTWNMDLVKDIYATAAREARAIGIHQLFTLVIEPNRDPRLGRNEEGYSEDPYLCSRIAEAIVEGHRVMIFLHMIRSLLGFAIILVRVSLLADWNEGQWKYQKER